MLLFAVVLLLAAGSVSALPPVPRLGGRRGLAAAVAAAEPGALTRHNVGSDVMVPSPAYSANVSLAVACTLASSALVLSLALQTIYASPRMSARAQRLLTAWAALRLRFIVPLTTTTAFLMYSSSDVLSQAAAAYPAPRCELDLARSFRSGFCSSFLSGFIACFYFRWLEALTALPASWEGVKHAWWLPVLAKIVIDIGCWEPFYDCIYISMQASLRGESAAQWRNELRKVPQVWAMSPRYWTLVDLVNFSIIPLRLRPVYNACFSIPWGMYLSSMANRKEAPNDDAEQSAGRINEDLEWGPRGDERQLPRRYPGRRRRSQ